MDRDSNINTRRHIYTMEKKFFSKKVRHRCSVRGCRSLDTTLISCSRDWSNSIYLCDDCIKRAYGIVKKKEAEAKKAAKAEAKKAETEPENEANND